jgi:hypothetical protein
MLGQARKALQTNTFANVVYLMRKSLIILTPERKLTLRVTVVPFTGAAQIAYYSTFKILDTVS